MGTTNRLAFLTLLMVTTAHPASAAPTDCAPLPLPLALPLAATPCCPCACELAELQARERAAREMLAVGLTVLVPAYIAGTAYAFSLPGSVRAVDSLPIFGALAAGARDTRRDNHSALFFSSGAQFIGAFMTVLAAVELANVHERRWQFDVAAGPGSAQLSAQLHW